MPPPAPLPVFHASAVGQNVVPQTFNVSHFTQGQPVNPIVFPGGQQIRIRLPFRQKKIRVFVNLVAGFGQFFCNRLEIFLAEHQFDF